MKITFAFNTQEGIIIALIVIMVIFRTVLGMKLRRQGRVANVKDAVKMFLLSDLGIISLVVIYILTAVLKLSLMATIGIILLFMVGFIIIYKKV